MALLGLAGAARAQVALDPARPAPVLDGRFEALAAAPAAPAALAEAPAAPTRVARREEPGPPVGWSRVSVRSGSDRDAVWVVPLSVDRATVYVVGPAGVLDTLVTGRSVPLAERSSRQAQPPAVALDLPAGAARTLVLHVEHDPSGYTYPMEVRPETAEQAHIGRWRDGVSQGAFVGLLLGLAVYNLFLFGTFRDRSYLYYVLFLLGSVVYWSTQAGFVVAFVWPETVRGYFELNFFGLALAAGAYVLFARAFLKTREFAPCADPLLRAFAVAWGAWALGGLAGLAGAPVWPAVQTAAALTAVAMLVTTVGAGVLAHRRGYVPARFFLLATAPLAVTGVAFALDWLGGVETPWDPAVAFQAGMGAEAVLFAVALSYRVRILHRDRAEAVAAHRVAEATNAALLKTDQLRTDLLGFAAHDLRSPLTGIVGFADMIGEDAEPGSDLADFVGVIRKDAQRMLSLIDDLLVTAAIDGQGVTLNAAPADLSALVREVVAAYRPRAEAKGQSLRLVGADAPAVAALDVERFREVVDNVVSNAVKYTPPGGAVEVAVRAGPSHAVSVSDTGPGLTAEDQRKLFGRFQRLSARPTGGESSTGLGLAIARDLVELHGGAIAVESGPGRGATFTITVPALAEPVAA